MSLHPVYMENQPQTQHQDKRPILEPIHGMQTSLKALADASNITLEALEAAIILRQQQLLQRPKAQPTTTTTTSAPLPPASNVRQ